MTQKDRMLQLVLNNEQLMKQYGYTAEQINDIDLHEALHSDNAVIASVARISKCGGRVAVAAVCGGGAARLRGEDDRREADDRDGRRAAAAEGDSDRGDEVFKRPDFGRAGARPSP